MLNLIEQEINSMKSKQKSLKNRRHQVNTEIAQKQQ